MANKPNKMGRIEAEVKGQINIPWNTIGTTLLVIMLVVLGVAGTLRFQKEVDNIKAQGVSEFKASSCDTYADKKTKAEWLECDAQ